MTTPDGPYTVIRWGSRWSIEDVLDAHRKQPLFDTHQAAQQEADRRNRDYEARHRPRPPQPAQTRLFDLQETN